MMVLPLIFYVISMLLNTIITSVFMTMRMKKLDAFCVPLFGFWNIKELLLPKNVINRRAYLSCFWWRNICNRMGKVICVGAYRIEWNYKYQTLSIENTKAQICRLGFTNYLLQRRKIETNMIPSILAFSALTCNRQCEKTL